MVHSSFASKILTIVIQTILFSLILNYSNIYSQDSKPVSHAFHDAFVFGVDGGVTISQTDYEKNKVGYSLRAVTEYFFKTNSVHLFGLKLKLGSEEISGEDSRSTISSQDGPRDIPPVFKTSVFSVGLGLTYSISVNDVFFPYVSAGFTNLWFDPKDDAGKPGEGNASGLYSTSAYAYSLELGFKVLVSDRLSINVSGNPYLPQTDYLDDVAGAFENDSYTSLLVGFSYSPFFDTDSDKDGISGSDDYCPDQPEDFDGFEDEDGCPDYDNDQDGILDINDQCPNEAEDFDGFEDEDGCPDYDNDGDGILDVNDKCPNEPENINGIEDEDGCPENNLLIEEGKIILLTDDIFAQNSDNIKEEGRVYLDEAISQMQEFPEEKWRIEGHTDSIGNKRFLRTLSLDRAKAVLEYITSFSVLNRENFQVFGMGDSSPITDNSTEQGRIANRRIEILLVGANQNLEGSGKSGEVFNQFILRGDDTFESNSATLKELAKILLTEIATYISGQPESKWRIEGYMDNQGSASLLKKLSYNRAEAVYDYLVSEGLNPGHFSIYGFGSDNPVGSNDTQEGRSLNRRVLIIREE